MFWGLLAKVLSYSVNRSASDHSPDSGLWLNPFDAFAGNLQPWKKILSSLGTKVDVYAPELVPVELQIIFLSWKDIGLAKSLFCNGMQWDSIMCLQHKLCMEAQGSFPAGCGHR